MNPNLVRRHFATSGKAHSSGEHDETSPQAHDQLEFFRPQCSETRDDKWKPLFVVDDIYWSPGHSDETYDIMGVWPKEVRNDLKVAVWAKQKQNLGAAAGYFERAYATAVLLPDPVASFGADYPIKISAIALSLAGVLESASDLPRAYSAYRTAFADLTRSLSHPSSSFTSIEADRRTRAIGIALKMVELGEQILRERALGRAPTDSKYGPVNEAEIEGKLDWALREALRMQNVSVKPSEKDEEKENAMLSLPTWAKGVTLASTMERAAEYYSRKGKLEYAAALYFLAISTLFPLPGQTPCDFFPFPSSPSTRDRCKAATLMNNLSSLFASATTVDTIPQATAWAEKALEVARTAKGESKAASEEHLECLRVISVLLSNLKKLKKGQTGKQPGQAQFIHELAVNMSKVSERRVEAHERVGRLRSQPPKP
ncbi:hypothetical protein FRC04_009366 [Tulasnella sp. 424]|nr:hypothetical protein FRC04_009366 [Tulasnella sp. 424]